jgi:hypothetical protein
VTARLWRELSRRLASGETRLYEEDLTAALSVSAAALGEAFQALRQAGLADWEGPYLYLRPCPEEAPAAPPAAQEELALVYQAIHEATGKTFSSAEDGRIREWLAVLGLRDLLDEIGLSRQRGPCRLSELCFALDKACRRRARLSPFGPLGGRGVLPDLDGRPAGGEALASDRGTANAAAYAPVPPDLVRRWTAAHPELYADRPPEPPPAPDSRPAAWASAYDPVPAEAVYRWAEAFPGEYAAYRREYRRLAERAESGPFRRRPPRARRSASPASVEEG